MAVQTFTRSMSDFARSMSMPQLWRTFSCHGAAHEVGDRLTHGLSSKVQDDNVSVFEKQDGVVTVSGGGVDNMSGEWDLYGCVIGREAWGSGIGSK